MKEEIPTKTFLNCREKEYSMQTTTGKEVANRNQEENTTNVTLHDNTFEELVNKFYEGNLDVITAIAQLLKKKLVASINISDLKIKNIVHDTKAKTILIHFTFNHDYFSRDSVIAIKFSSQKSKSVVPSQIQKYKKIVLKRLLSLKINEADVTTIMLVPKFTSGVSRLNEDMSYSDKLAKIYGKFFVTTPSRLFNDIDSHLFKYLRQRIIGFVKNARKKADEGKKISKITQAIGKLVMFLSALNHMIFGKRLLLPYEVQEVVDGLIITDEWEDVVNYVNVHL